MTIDPERRRFLSVALAAAAAFVAAGCSPKHSKARTRRSLPGLTSGRGSFGDRIDVGAIADIRRTLASTPEPYYVAEARSYVVKFPADLADRARAAYPTDAIPMLEAGIIVLYQRCTHLGCRVPWCKTSEWFECPCHAARFDQVGEKRAGPAPRGMDLVQSSIKDGRLVLDTGKILRGAAIGTNTTNQKPAGPFCV